MRVWHPVEETSTDPDDDEVRFAVFLREVPVWRLVVARVVAWLPCACCREWPWHVGFGRRDEDGYRPHTLGAWWWRGYNTLTGLDLPIGRMLRVRVPVEDLRVVAPRFVVRTIAARERDRDESREGLDDDR